MDDDAELAAMMRESELRREQGALDEDDAELSGDEREPLRRAASSSSSAASASRSGPPSRWRLLVGAVLFLARVFVDIGRRCLRIIELNVPRYIALVDRCLVYVIRVSVHPRKKINSLRLLSTLLVIAAVPFIILTMYRVQLASASGHDPLELTEDHIKPIIIVEHMGEPTPTRRQALLRDGGDGLRVEPVGKLCLNTRQGPSLVTDSAGYVCSRRQLDRSRPGCCNETDTSLPRIKQYACDLCDTSPPHCCDVYEHCVSCCMHPLNMELRRDYLTHVDPSHPVYQDPSQLTVFEFCASRCRTSSASVQHQNSYRSRRTFCYGIHRPLKVLPTVNSDDELSPSSPAANEPPATPALDLDPFYARSR